MNLEISPRLQALFLWLLPRKRNICNAFSTPSGKATLRYLAKYCFASAPTKTEREVGRRDVWLFLNHHLHLSDEELTVLYEPLNAEERYQIHKPSTTYFTQE